MDKIFKIDSFEEFSVTCDNIFTNLLDQEVGGLCENELIDSASKQTRELILSSYGNIDKLSITLLSTGYEANKVKYFVSLIEKRKSELLYLILIEQTCKQGETFASFDWVIKLICGTSDLKTLKYPLMQLSFTTFLNGFKQKERLFEVDKSILAMFIEVLENIDLSV
ncbi:unnamed protein product [Pieris brassicae]|uniref:COMM domain-containing protein n=1 Tax=Pieris brassicae TaxID=7116 RepID=A0A9P0TX82_PIEBR|nr:unnamed protein product [Pieris brassicae]